MPLCIDSASATWLAGRLSRESVARWTLSSRPPVSQFSSMAAFGTDALSTVLGRRAMPSGGEKRSERTADETKIQTESCRRLDGRWCGSGSTRIPLRLPGASPSSYATECPRGVRYRTNGFDTEPLDLDPKGRISARSRSPLAPSSHSSPMSPRSSPALCPSDQRGAHAWGKSLHPAWTSEFRY